MELGPTTAVASAIEGLLVVDEAGRVVFANPATEKIFGLPAAKIVQSSCRTWKPTAVDGKPFPVEELPPLRVIRTGEAASCAEHTVERADGTKAILSDVATLLRDERGGVSGAVVSLMDISERRRANDQVRAAEQSLRSFLDGATSGIALHREGRVVYVNSALIKMLGYERSDQLVGRPVYDVVHHDDRAAVAERIHAMLEHQRDVPLREERLLHRDGRVVEVEVSAVPLVLEGQRTILAAVADVSERNRVQRDRDCYLSLLRATLEATADGILVVDLEGRISAYNERFVEMWRLPRTVMELKDDEQALSFVLDQLEDPDAFLTSTRQLYATPDAENDDTLQLKDGRIYERYSRPQRIDGKCVGRVWSFRDATERRRAESERERLLAKIQEKHELLESVIEHVPVGITLRRGTDLVYELVNPAFESIFGAKLRLGRSFAEVGAETNPALAPILERVLATGEPYCAVDVPYRVRRTPNGPIEEVYLWLDILRVPSPKGPAVLALVVDTTEQVHARRRIEALAQVAHRQAAELQSIHDSMVDGVVACDAAGRITLVNDAEARLMGVRASAVLGRTLRECIDLLDIRQLDGKPFLVEDVPLARALAGEVVSKAASFSDRAGRKIYVRSNATPIRNAVGEVVGAVSVDRDVSESTEFDMLKDQFIRVAAHELKTPVAIMKGYAELLLRSAGQLPKALEGGLEAIDRGATRIGRIVDDLLDVSQLQLGQMELRYEKVDLPELVDVVTRRLALTSKKHRIEVTEAEPVVVRADRARLEQVLGKLIDNAIRYSPRGGDVEVSVKMEGRTAIVCVRDHGVGIPREKQERIFQRFYRAHTDTPQDYGGMGVGLYIAREIIAQHGGEMWFESEEGSGSTFCFSLRV